MWENYEIEKNIIVGVGEVVCVPQYYPSLKVTPWDRNMTSVKIIRTYRCYAFGVISKLLLLLYLPHLMTTWQADWCLASHKIPPSLSFAYYWTCNFIVMFTTASWIHSAPLPYIHFNLHKYWFQLTKIEQHIILAGVVTVFVNTFMLRTLNGEKDDWKVVLHEWRKNNWAQI
jgi:hypothetical protein